MSSIWDICCWLHTRVKDNCAICVRHIQEETISWETVVPCAMPPSGGSGATLLGSRSCSKFALWRTIPSLLWPSVALIVQWGVLFIGYCEASRDNAHKDSSKCLLNIVSDGIIYYLLPDFFFPIQSAFYMASLGDVGSIQ